MTRIVRLLVLTMAVLLASWSVAQAAGSTAMALDMASTGHHGGTVHCEGCDDHGATDSKANVQCHSICVAPVLADLTDALETRPDLRESHDAASISPLTGRTDPPEPYPPRTLLN